jgi:ABC-2 type transport system ATP-binding protein
VIEVHSLSRYYGERRAVDDVSFSIRTGEVVGLLGLNGAGKSTTLKVLAGLILPSSGTVTVDGFDMSQAPVAVRSRIGFLPEDPPLYTEMTVTEFLFFVGGLRGLGRPAIAERLPVVLGIAQLNEVAGRVIGELSHGFRKRVGIAQAIIHSPKLIILDEPISGLDPVQIVDMRAVIRSLAKESTVIVSSHILSEISQTCDRLIVLNDGRLVATGTEAELAANLKTGGTIDVSVRGTIQAAIAVINAVSGVGEVVAIAESDGRAQLRVNMKEDCREAIVSALVAGGLGVRGVEDAADELEQIFLDLTRSGKAKTDEQGASA